MSHLDDAINRLNWIYGIQFDGSQELAIRELVQSAADDALEQAALALESKMTPETEDEELSYHGAFLEAAGIVRELKHYK